MYIFLRIIHLHAKERRMIYVVRILIADDHALIRQGVRGVVEKEPDLEVVAEASDGHEAALRASETQPDVVLMDLAMPICDGFEATKRVLACSPHSRVVIFSASDQEEDALQALQRGAIGYITKDTEPEGLLTAIRRAAQNELYMASPLAQRLLALLGTLTLAIPQERQTLEMRHASYEEKQSVHSRRRKSKRNLPLTGREKEILNLIRLGQRNREIAHELRIAEATVHKHIQNIFEKLNARNRAEALFLAKELSTPV
jgi:two-component system nitrate/nitrite response regulator NarL